MVCAVKVKRQDVMWFNVFGYTVVSLFALVCLIPFIMIISSSFTSEAYILRYGYTIIPRDFTVRGYTLALMNPAAILQSYAVTTFVTVSTTVLSVFVCVMTGYVLQRKDFNWRFGFSFFFFFTTLFNGGLVPWYILCIKYLHFKNNILALIIPGIVSVWNILLVKGYMAGIPYEITESAKIDGAGDFRIFVRLILPISKPIVATLALFTAIGTWNDWFGCMIFISDERLFTLQYFLYKLLNSVQVLKSIMERTGREIPNIPVESMKMSLTVIVTGPIILVYPFIQKHFVKGLTLGAVKG